MALGSCEARQFKFDETSSLRMVIYSEMGCNQGHVTSVS